MDDLGLQFEFLPEADQRNHDFRIHLDLLFLDVGRGFKDGAHLHFSNLRVGDGQTTTAVTKHRVEFMQFVDALLDLCRFHLELLGEVGDLLAVMRQELV